MNILVENIGMIRQSNIEINGITVIAGSNDTGKSTIGKVLFATIKSLNIIRSKKNPDIGRTLATWFNLTFDGNATFDTGKICFSENTAKIELGIKNNNNKHRITVNSLEEVNNIPFTDATFIHTPIVFDLSSFFVKILSIKNNMDTYDIFSNQRKKMKLDFGFSYPVTLWDLHNKIYQDNPFPNSGKSSNLAGQIKKIMGGEIKKNYGKLSFEKNVKNGIFNIEISNTAFGIKSFGVLQLINNNGYLTKKNLLIIDEPENHLHPEWQLKYAQILVELARTGVCILVNTHSPYMLQAINKYSNENKIVKNKTKFYLAQTLKNDWQSEIIDKTENLNDIFIRLAKPLQDITWG
ncbi:AAA family ATPase [Campylobacter mucosalis]|uniref:ATPase, AAA family n=1 Tax=Campylobacter mucosalis CCUG 21559 TaxID=1032067 RepID=A0A6G5QE00_9BACT|nr:AAA family ATPase [Campylobacter mucosalis]QCD43871.1 ATPase, AAA family [Campylobacter mucosalis CCUG 21559]